MAKNLHSQMTIRISAALPLGSGANDAIANATNRNQQLITAMSDLGYRSIEVMVDVKRRRGEGEPEELPALPKL